ncbi:hypothetical protein C9374_010776 [Naegleria lovaniensis]|uniref:Heparinase II/III-like C-terminal domain-containing protein n=1 Tax=Naegleria lovaniensis TaxID=51637 RepID=A0AA88GB80_NAELO|nr:uncharacterized protein C9374_010776 [Naegleria lovaniensis]KAG2374492.1 hypothetical protein C9374_010776 [Naegleria lovaniensis]
MVGTSMFPIISIHTRAIFPTRPNSTLIRWVLNQKSIPPPSWTSVFFPNASFAIMRSGWTATDHYALMDIASLGYGHEHQDKLNIIIEPYGRRRLLFDNGGGDYEQSVFRTYSLSKESHNTVLVDGFSQKRQKRVPWDLIGYGNANTPRPIFETHCLIMPWDDYPRAIPMYLVIDEMSSVDGLPHTYEARWHLRTTNVQFNSTLKLLTPQTMANLAIISLSKETQSYHANAQTSPKILRFDIQRGSSPILATTYVTSQNGLKNTILTLLIPLKPYQTPNISNVIEIVPSSHYQFLMLNDDKSLNWTIDLKIEWILTKLGSILTSIVVNTSRTWTELIYESIAPTSLVKPEPSMAVSSPRPSKSVVKPNPTTRSSSRVVNASNSRMKHAWNVFTVCLVIGLVLAFLCVRDIFGSM